tara:strand:- start:105 stop:542 length:438 start_codon:yes stop_codon:yes gene_type:complete
MNKYLPLMTSFTRDIIPYAEAHKVSPHVMSVAIPKNRKREEFDLVPYDDVIACNEKACLQVKPVAEGRFLCLINGHKLDNTRHATEAAARIHHWSLVREGKAPAEAPKVKPANTRQAQPKGKSQRQASSKRKPGNQKRRNGANVH